jgi:hypothetical protein
MKRYAQCMTPEERKAMDDYFNRVMDVVVKKVQYLPEEHKADIRKVLEEA